MKYDLRTCIIGHVQGLSFPPNVGLPLSGATGAQYVLMQTHYNNPKMKSNYVDSSGIRLYYTLTKRQHDAAVLSVGHVVERYPYSVPFFLPPHRNDMALVNLCPGECTNLVNSFSRNFFFPCDY